MKSLKAILPDMGQILGLTHHVLYVRQQTLAREGLLSVRPGHGPGSGVIASPDSVAVLLIALLASGSPADTAKQARIFCAAAPVSQICPLTAAKNLHDAFAAIFADVILARRVTSVEIWSDEGHAALHFNGAVSAFRSNTPPASCGLLTRISTTGDVLRAIATLLT